MVDWQPPPLLVLLVQAGRDPLGRGVGDQVGLPVRVVGHEDGGVAHHPHQLLVAPLPPGVPPEVLALGQQLPQRRRHLLVRLVLIVVEGEPGVVGRRLQQGPDVLAAVRPPRLHHPPDLLRVRGHPRLRENPAEPVDLRLAEGGLGHLEGHPFLLCPPEHLLQVLVVVLVVLAEDEDVVVDSDAALDTPEGLLHLVVEDP